METEQSATFRGGDDFMLKRTLYAAMSEQDADRKSSRTGGPAAGGLVLGCPEDDVKQL